RPFRCRYVQPHGGAGDLPRSRERGQGIVERARLLESVGPGEYVEPVIAGLITIAVVGMLQTLGAFAATVPDATWRSDASREDGRALAAGRGPSNPDVLVPAMVGIAHHVSPTVDLVVQTVAYGARVRCDRPEPRAPPALLTPRSL